MNFLLIIRHIAKPKNDMRKWQDDLATINFRDKQTTGKFWQSPLAIASQKDHNRFDYICNQMTARFKYLLLFIVWLCYLQSAFEVNTDTIKNTWGDKYDTYIHADNNTTQHIFKVEHQTNFALPSDFSGFHKIEIYKPIFVPDFHSFFDTSPPKFFLKYCSLLI